MSAKILDGKKVAEKIKAELQSEIENLKKTGIQPGLAVVLVGEDPASQIYVGKKEETCQELGIVSFPYKLPENTSEKDLLDLISKCNADEKIHGILVQLPLPKHIDEMKIVSAISLEKDVDCFHPENLGRMFLGQPSFLPCTPAGIMELLESCGVSVEGKDAVIIGKSNIAGKPTAFMLINKDATVTICHLKTKNLKEKTLGADIIISAAGKAGLITKDMVKQGAVLVDVGMNRSKEGKLTGDIDFNEVSKIAAAITPVPGGIGPMTITMLMKNTVKAAKKYYANRS